MVMEYAPHMKPFTSMALAGGGCRCFWQLGFWEAAAGELGLQDSLQTVAAVSAGAAMACAAVLDKGRHVTGLFREAAARNPRNATPGNLLRPGKPLCPHTRMYREAMHATVAPEDMARLHAGPDIRVFIGRPPALLGPRAGMMLGLGLYLVERYGGDPLHGGLAYRAGFTGEVARVRDCATPEELIDIVLASSCTPPFTPALRRGGHAVIDGGVVESVPIGALPEAPGRTLVLLTRRYGTMPPPSEDRVYVHPSQPIPVSKWDYTSPEGVDAAFDLGFRDGERFLREK